MNNVETGYLLVEVPKDGNSWTPLKFMTPESFLGCARGTMASSAGEVLAEGDVSRNRSHESGLLYTGIRPVARVRDRRKGTIHEAKGILEVAGGRARCLAVFAACHCRTS